MIVEWSATELSAAVSRREVSCVEVMTAYLDQIDRLNPSVNALVALRPRAELLAEAATADRIGPRGWMHGFPFAVKDLADVAGLPTSAGYFRDPPPATADSLHVERIRAAGAIFIGKTNVPEFGLGSHTYNTVFGTTLNAYDQRRSAGGSSGGAAVAVALRMVPLADGSDFMGSLRNPPGWNNVLGLRPSVGRVPSIDDEVFVAQSSVAGPIARTALDLAWLLRTMSGYDPRAPLSLHDDPATLTSFDDVTGRKVAWLGDLRGYLPMEPSVRQVTNDARAGFAELGMTVTDALPDFPLDDLWPTWLTLRHWMAGFAPPDRIENLKPELVYELRGADHLSGRDVLLGSARRSALYQAFRELFETYDYAVLPTAQVMPFAAGAHWPTHIGDVPMSSYHRWMEVSTIATLINAPALAMPAGFSADGLPIGLQVIGRNHDDRSLLSLAAAWEDRTPWLRRRPPLIG
ncbi:amidase [Paractinoplanes ferrugineus]|uniref:Amidase n=1 Tax=Paractinoplanes ferrugineus TaxID=113564 RepID=A0A919IXS7_9ACTN|nr:amidase [Actinoplanes ferrugineus]GIE11021.1 amidase [Actinoplanes ferrugineus]